jgi:hypothetical protein
MEKDMKEEDEMIEIGKSHFSLGLLAWAFDSTTVDNGHLVELGLCLSPFETFIGSYLTRTHVEIEEADAANVVVISTVPTQTDSTTVAHP